MVGGAYGKGRIWYGMTGALVLNFSNPLQQLLCFYHPDGSYTHMTLALYWMNSILSSQARPTAHKILLIGTDGRSNDDNVVDPSAGLLAPTRRLRQLGK